MVCIPPFIDYLFRVYLIFWLLYFGLFQVKVQLVSKWNDGLHYYLVCGLLNLNIYMKLDLVVCCVLSGRGLCDGMITCPERSYRVWCV